MPALPYPKAGWRGKRSLPSSSVIPNLTSRFKRTAARARPAPKKVEAPISNAGVAKKKANRNGIKSKPTAYNKFGKSIAPGFGVVIHGVYHRSLNNTQKPKANKIFAVISNPSHPLQFVSSRKKGSVLTHPNNPVKDHFKKVAKENPELTKEELKKHFSNLWKIDHTNPKSPNYDGLPIEKTKGSPSSA
ncbi:hypothetical protein FGG08_007297 [Glutinoglossum americanum]|uniref:Uncharacterized protein n=1 Tax=Glutinoglossum americanum TaxID=1670608 RepID=A0A9P8HZM4_9PEZI|nr:hypothetical protein FGG08_007297 [Glutinoglossum americanum]